MATHENLPTKQNESDKGENDESVVLLPPNLLNQNEEKVFNKEKIKIKKKKLTLKSPISDKNA